MRVVYEGVLLPWGHRAALVKISERRFHNDVEGNPAFLRQRMFIVVRQPHLAYTAPGLKNAAGGSLEWTRVAQVRAPTLLLLRDVDRDVVSVPDGATAGLGQRGGRG